VTPAVARGDCAGTWGDPGLVRTQDVAGFVQAGPKSLRPTDLDN